LPYAILNNFQFNKSLLELKKENKRLFLFTLLAKMLLKIYIILFWQIFILSVLIIFLIVLGYNNQLSWAEEIMVDNNSSSTELKESTINSSTTIFNSHSTAINTDTTNTIINNISSSSSSTALDFLTTTNTQVLFTNTTTPLTNTLQTILTSSSIMATITESEKENDDINTQDDATTQEINNNLDNTNAASETFLSLKERRLEKYPKTITTTTDCEVLNFTANISNTTSMIVELQLKQDATLQNLEIGSLPQGIDITFLNNASYALPFASVDRQKTAILHIINYPYSQKGNFNIPIIYTNNESTAICQINIINL
jgi:hypothetical protein